MGRCSFCRNHAASCTRRSICRYRACSSTWQTWRRHREKHRNLDRLVLLVSSRERFEWVGENRRFHPGELLREGSEFSFLPGNLIERGQVNLNPSKRLMISLTARLVPAASSCTVTWTRVVEPQAVCSTSTATGRPSMTSVRRNTCPSHICMRSSGIRFSSHIIRSRRNGGIASS